MKRRMALSARAGCLPIKFGLVPRIPGERAEARYAPRDRRIAREFAPGELQRWVLVRANAMTASIFGTLLGLSYEARKRKIP
jgi:hypothetical protein